MGVQSAAVRLFMKMAPSTNVMTTNTTQLAIDATIVFLALCRCGDAGQTRESRDRLGGLLAADGGVHRGTLLGALCFQLVGVAAIGAPLVAGYALLGWVLWRGIGRSFGAAIAARRRYCRRRRW